MTTHAPAAAMPANDDTPAAPRPALIPGTRRVDTGEAALDAIAGLSASINNRLDGMAVSLSDLQRNRHEDLAVAARRHEATMSAMSTVLARVDTSEAVTDALRHAMEQVHDNARTAKEDVAALGNQVGKSTAELAAATNEHRGTLTSLVERDEKQERDIRVAKAVATQARRLSAIRFGGIAVGAVLLWELLQRLYPLLHR